MVRSKDIGVVHGDITDGASLVKMKLEKVNLQEKLQLFSEHWVPHIVGSLNGQHVKVAKLLGEFEWHQHTEEDELFFVIAGSLELHLRDRVVVLQPGEFFIVPQGVEHKPVADSEVQVMLFEPASTVNTGDTPSERTVRAPKTI
jgi:mannose-6-phosphate isomerase-like protein (cupin superfamily)